jgi:hypothetical protein
LLDKVQAQINAVVVSVGGHLEIEDAGAAEVGHSEVGGGYQVARGMGHVRSS